MFVKCLPFCSISYTGGMWLTDMSEYFRWCLLTEQFQYSFFWWKSEWKVCTDYHCAWRPHSTCKKAFSWLSAIPRYFFRKAVFADLTLFTKYLLMQCFTADGDNEDFPMLVFTTGYRNILNFRINALWNSSLPNCACMCLCAWCEVRSQLQILAENRRIFLFYFLVFGAKYEDCASTIELSAFLFFYFLFFLLHQKELLHCQPVNIAKCNISTNC